MPGLHTLTSSIKQFLVTMTAMSKARQSSHAMAIRVVLALQQVRPIIVDG